MSSTGQGLGKGGGGGRLHHYTHVLFLWSVVVYVISPVLLVVEPPPTPTHKNLNTLPSITWYTSERSSYIEPLIFSIGRVSFGRHFRCCIYLL